MARDMIYSCTVASRFCRITRVLMNLRRYYRIFEESIFHEGNILTELLPQKIQGYNFRCCKAEYDEHITREA
jgi:hypothetical protein